MCYVNGCSVELLHAHQDKEEKKRHLFLIAQCESDAFVAARGRSSTFTVRDRRVWTITPFMSGSVQKVATLSSLVSVVVARDG